MLDSIAIIAITGQVPQQMMGLNSFQEIPTVDITKPITKRNYLVLQAEDIPRIIHEAFCLTTSGRPGSVLIDIPKDIRQKLAVPDLNGSIALPGCLLRLP